MSQSYEPHRLVIQHLSVLESAPAIVEKVEAQVFAAIDKKINDWVGSQDVWEGIYDFFNEETTFKPVLWDKNEDGDYCSWYTLECDDEEHDSYHLSALLGIVPVRLGIPFKVDASWVTRLNGKRARPGAAWKSFLAEQFPQTKLGELGFELHGESLFLPIRVDAQILAEDYPNSLDEALTPVDDALKKIEAAHPKIDALIKTAQEYQFAKSVALT